jgi:hypothetical protein
VLLVEEALSVRHTLAPYQGGTAASTDRAIKTERFPGQDLPAVKPFALVDALGRGDVTGALAAVHDQLVSGREPLDILGLVGWQLQRWVAVRRLLDAGEPIERLAALTGLRPWQAQRAQSEVAGRSLASLQDLLARCWQFDVQAKRGLAMPALVVEQLVMEVCQAGLPAPSGRLSAWPSARRADG